MRVKNRKIILIMVITLTLIEISSLFLMYNSYNSKSILNEKNISNKNNMFAIMLEQSDGTFKESKESNWPGIGYNYNPDESGCINDYGEKVDGVLKYKHGVNSAIVETDETVFCYLFFDILTDDLTVNIDSEDKNIPLVGKYKKSVYCDNSEVYINNKYDRLEFANLKNPNNCTLFIEEDTEKHPTLISIIKDLKEKTIINSGICKDNTYKSKEECENAGAYWWGVFDENGLRYEGMNPDNYIWFNNEMWRIIGYVPSKNDEQKDTHLVKIIREEPIGSYSRKSSTFTSSYVYNLLNEYYYEQLDGTKSGYCYGYGTSITTSCDYKGIGLNELSRQLIVPVQWTIGAYGTSAISNTQYTKEIASWTGVEGGINVGLMNASDYAYGVLNADCNHASVKIGAYNTANCAGKNWLYSYGYEWTNSKFDGDGIWRIHHQGHLAEATTGNLGNVRPVVYLNSEIYVISGNGSITDPYYIAL